jgi:hypothetical protein
MKLHIALVAVVAVLLSPAPALACSCIGEVPLCQSFWQADAVFAGEVVAFEKIDPKQFFSRRVARVRVERVWRGEVAGVVEVSTGAGGGDCGYSFRNGQQYVIYAYKGPQGTLSTNICTPTKLLSRASADLEYFKGVSEPSSGGRIYGTARFETKGSDLVAAKGAAIVLNGNARSWHSAADDKGAFEFTGIPVGEYTIAMEGAPLPPWKVQLRDVRACIAVNLWAPRPSKSP